MIERERNLNATDYAKHRGTPLSAIKRAYETGQFSKLASQDTEGFIDDTSTDDCFRILRHTLTGSVGEDVYRNYYAIGPDHRDWKLVNLLVEMGFMRAGRNVPGQEYQYFHCTRSGAKVVGLLYQEPWTSQQINWL